MESLPPSRQVTRIDRLLESFREELTKLTRLALYVKLPEHPQASYYREKTSQHINRAVAELSEAREYLGFLKDPARIAHKNPSDMSPSEHKRYIQANEDAHK